MYTIRMSEYASLDEAGKASVLSKAARALGSTPNEALRKTRERIVRFERTHGFDSEQMKSRLASGEIKETRDVCDWLMLLNLAEHLGAVINSE